MHIFQRIHCYNNNGASSFQSFKASISALARHWLTTCNKCRFSKAAATRSLSFSCLFTDCSDWWVPGWINTSTLYLRGRHRNNLTRMQRPINVAMEQCGMVGVKRIQRRDLASSSSICWSWTTCNSSKVMGCSGSLMQRIRSIKIRGGRGTLAKDFFFVKGIVTVVVQVMQSYGPFSPFNFEDGGISIA